MDDLRRRIDELLHRVAELETREAEWQVRYAELKARNAELEAQNAELERRLKRRGKKFTPKPNAGKSGGPKTDRRKKPHRSHPGVFREPPAPDENTIHHDVRLPCCPHCGGEHLTDSGNYDDHLVEEIPQPKVELHCYRRHEQECQNCGRRFQGRGEEEIPGSQIGPRARLLAGYCRGHLGISLGKTNDLLRQLFGLNLSRAGTLGHIRWSAALFDPVVERLFEILRESPVIHADETGWRINGKNVWAWCFSNPRLALFLIDKHRSRAVVKQALGDSLEGVLVTDFYASYNRINCRKQKCLVHLLRELSGLRDELSPRHVKNYVEPVMKLFQDALELSEARERMTAPAYAAASAEIERRLDDLIWQRPTEPDCRRINKRLVRHRFELLTFLEHPDVPADNNLCESDIRSVAAARSDGGVNRSTWGAKAFATLKSVIRTCGKNGRNFLEYGLSVLQARQSQSPLPLPIDSG
jgi:transposase